MCDSAGVLDSSSSNRDHTVRYPCLQVGGDGLFQEILNGLLAIRAMAGRLGRWLPTCVWATFLQV